MVACPALLATPAAPAALALASLFSALEISAKEWFHWEDQGLDEEHYVFASFLYSNNVAREQVLLDNGYDYFQHENAGRALAAAARQFMFPADTDSDHD